MERFRCIKCRKELHRQCAESFTVNCCKQCDPNPFRYNTSSSATSPSPTSLSSNTSIDINNLIPKENCYVKILTEKKCQFLMPDLLEGAIEYVKKLRTEQNLEKDKTMDEYVKPSTYTLQIYALFYVHDEGDMLLSLAFCENHENRCLIEIFALPTTFPKNGAKKEMITTFFVKLVKHHRTLAKAVHVRVPSELRGLSSEIFAELSLKLPKENIAVKTLKETLVSFRKKKLFFCKYKV